MHRNFRRALDSPVGHSVLTFCGCPTCRESLKAVDMKFTVTEVGGGGHKDTWVSASMTGSCDAKWVKVGDSWKISEDMITAKPA